MPLKRFKPYTPSRRTMTVSDFAELTDKKPEKRLLRSKSRISGRNNAGRITMRRRGGGAMLPCAPHAAGNLRPALQPLAGEAGHAQRRPRDRRLRLAQQLLAVHDERGLPPRGQRGQQAVLQRQDAVLQERPARDLTHSNPSRTQVTDSRRLLRRTTPGSAPSVRAAVRPGRAPWGA